MLAKTCRNEGVRQANVNGSIFQTERRACRLVPRLKQVWSVRKTTRRQEWLAWSEQGRVTSDDVKRKDGEIIWGHASHCNCEVSFGVPGLQLPSTPNAPWLSQTSHRLFLNFRRPSPRSRSGSPFSSCSSQF